MKELETFEAVQISSKREIFYVSYISDKYCLNRTNFWVGFKFCGKIIGFSRNMEITNEEEHSVRYSKPKMRGGYSEEIEADESIEKFAADVW